MSALPPGSCKTSLDLLPKILSLHYKQINKVKTELDEQPSSFLISMHVSSYKVNFSLAHLVFFRIIRHTPASMF